VRLTLLCLLLVGLLVFPASGAPRHPVLKISAPGIAGFEPATVPFTVFIEPHASHRVACVEMDGLGYYRRSCWELEGADAPRSFRFLYRDIPAGSYRLGLAVDSSELGVRTVSHAVEVLSRTN
jgi:hypothetical protein